MKTSIAIIIIIVLLAAGGTYLVLNKKIMQLEDIEKVNSIIAIFACAGGLISVTIAIGAFIQSNKIHKESQRPQLLIFVDNLILDENHGGPAPITRINYTNISLNMFDDLNILPVIKTEGTIVDLRNLFRSDMQIIGKDARQKQFNVFEKTKEHGFLLSERSSEDPPVYLELSYSYTFYKKKYKVLAQKYIWKTDTEKWEIY